MYGKGSYYQFLLDCELKISLSPKVEDIDSNALRDLMF
jgi:hypothetical protein